MNWVSLAAAGVLVVVAGCANVGGAEEPAPSSADLVITAAQMAFDPDELPVPAGRPVAILLRNRDAALHNVAIDREGGDAVFVGEFIGAGEILYSVPPLEAGRYLLRCDLHAGMTGAIVAS